MEEQGSWKGHSFTLVVFIGIVILCSIFFVLGMVVGRGQTPHASETPAAASAVKSAANAANAANDSHPPSVDADKDTQIIVDRSPVATKTEDAPARVPAKAKIPDPPPAPVAKPSSEKMIYLQVAALEQSATANKQVDDLRKKGFQAVVQITDGAKKLYHVQVGPFANVADVDIAKHKLEALGYKPFKK